MASQLSSGLPYSLDYAGKYFKHSLDLLLSGVLANTKAERAFGGGFVASEREQHMRGL
jgi:hypothetical protein